MSAEIIARVVVKLSLDREFDYHIPETLRGRVRVGARVQVPFGKTFRTAYVVSLHSHSNIATAKLKDILAIEGEREQIPSALIKLAQWMASYYCCTREQAVHAILPAVVRSGKIKKKRRKHLRLNNDADLAAVMPELEKRAPKQAAVLQALVRDKGNSSLARISRETGAGLDTVKRLEEKGLLSIEDRVEDRDPFAQDVILPSTALKLTGEQATVLSQIRQSIAAEKAAVILLYGVTGSGKTEVYLQGIADCIAAGKQAIVLVPEIALTPQTTQRFRSRFGDAVSVLHSGLSDGERFDEWMKIHEGRTQIAVGARSALFAPFCNLGLIVVDEEHESTYKQDEAPRYNARDVAVMRGHFENVTVVLGSATPALESYYNACQGKYILGKMPRRIDDRKMPHMEVVDMRAEAAMRGGAQIFSRRLETLIRERLNAGEQTILFLNRRGFATQMLCTVCGYVASCDDCSVTYTYHKREQRLVCHLCGIVLAAPTICPQCRDEKIRYTGLGTEKIETVARILFPKAAIARMDSDTMTAKDSYRKTLAAFQANRIQILIGTQMIAKGLDVPNVTLVGIIFADLGLHLPDFRAGERTFQLLTQVAGRSGRGDVSGHVIVQAYTPFHSALQHALEHDFLGFYAEEITMRRTLEFPPVTHMVIIHFRSADQVALDQYCEKFAAELKPLLPPAVQVAGPMPSPIARIRKLYRYQMMLRGGNILELTKLLRAQIVAAKIDDDINVYIDVDPQSLM